METAATSEQQSSNKDVGLGSLWVGMLAGPLVFAANLELSYAIVQWACAARVTWPLHAITWGSLAIVAAAAVLPWRIWRSLTPSSRLDGSSPGDRRRFMAVSGMILCGFFGLVILAADIPRWMLSPCD